MTPTEPIVRIRPTPNGRVVVIEGGVRIHAIPNGRLVVIEGGRREPRRRPVPTPAPKDAA